MITLRQSFEVSAKSCILCSMDIFLKCAKKYSFEGAGLDLVRNSIYVYEFSINLIKLIVYQICLVLILM